MRRLLIAALFSFVGCVDPVEICNNDVDDNNNGLADCQDTDFCGADPACAVVCGNDRIDPGEVCDGQQLNGQSCFLLGQGSGTLSCNVLCLFDTSQCVADAVCGNGILEADEECDDNNGSSGDGCDNNCTTTRCGNGIVTAGEQCDIGDTTPGDGCDQNCQVENNANCGDGNVDAGEDCDDQNNINTDACAFCQDARCGDGFIQNGVETCDDSNTTSGDNCSSVCQIEGPGGDICDAPPAASVGNNNGDTSGSPNFYDPSCQDADTADVVFRFTPTTTSLNITLDSATDQGFFITNTCDAAANEIDCVDIEGGGVDEVLTLNGLTIGAPIFIFVGAFAAGEEGPFTLNIAANTPPVCGNGTLEAGEQCDDGGTTSGDGCSSTCQSEGAIGGNPLLNEIDYEQVGTDNTEFIEIINNTNSVVDLTQFSLVLANGSTDVEYFATGRTTRISLGEAVNSAGTSTTFLQPGQFLVIASPNVTLPAGALRIRVGNADNFQNGQTAFDAAAGDAVAIINAANQVVDALSYEGNMTSVIGIDFTEGTGTGLNNFLFTAPHEGDNTNGAVSLIKISNTNNAQNDWQTDATPSPGAAN